mmetsp:Transcript_20594/g.58699  ORF Transcript_20594/g.58699 Transcript_20594/m.58699 type:complete len:228 (+) Transcript_20594:2685-3368(+)
MAEILSSCLRVVVCDQASFQGVGVQLIEGSQGFLAPAGGVFVRLAGVHDPDRVRQFPTVADDEPAASRGAFCLPGVPRKTFAAACIPADPPAASPRHALVSFVVHDQDFLLQLFFIRQHVRHQQHLQFQCVVPTFAFFSFPLALWIYLFLDDFLVDRSAIRRYVVGSFVATVQLWPRLTAGDVNRTSGCTFLVLLIIGDDAQCILHLLRSKVALLLVVIVRQHLQRL